MIKGIRVFVESNLQTEEENPLFYCRYVGAYQPLHPGYRLYDALLNEYTVTQVELVRGTRKNTPKILLKIQGPHVLRTIGSVLFTQPQEALRVPPGKSERDRLSGLAAPLSGQTSKEK